MTQTFHCPCCNLQQPVHVNHLEVSDQVCSHCIGHQGPSPDSALRRAEKHVTLLQERLESARVAADEAYKARDDYKSKMHHAYNSREKAIRYLQRVNDLHALRPNGACSCGLRNACRTAAVIYENWSQNMIGKLEDIDAERQPQEAAVAPWDDDPLYDWIWDRPHTDTTGEQSA